jgi:hypothetical protein
MLASGGLLLIGPRARTEMAAIAATTWYNFPASRRVRLIPRQPTALALFRWLVFSLQLPLLIGSSGPRSIAREGVCHAAI